VGADFMEKEVIVDGKVINLEVTIFTIRSGTLLVNKSSVVWEELSIVGPTAVYWSMTSRISEYFFI
jgi:hypothetical protein